MRTSNFIQEQSTSSKSINPKDIAPQGVYENHWVLVELDKLQRFDENDKIPISSCKRITDNFDPDIFEPIVVGRVVTDPDKRLVIMEGHARTIVAIEFLKVKYIRAYIKDVQSLEEVGEYYLSISNAKRYKSSIARHYAKLVTNDPKAWELENVCKKYGFKAKKGRTPYTISCWDEIIRIHNDLGINNLDDTLYVLNEAYHGDHISTLMVFIRGVSYFISQRKDHREFSLKCLVDGLRQSNINDIFIKLNAGDATGSKKKDWEGEALRCLTDVHNGNRRKHNILPKPTLR